MPLNLLNLKEFGKVSESRFVIYKDYGCKQTWGDYEGGFPGPWPPGLVCILLHLRCPVETIGQVQNTCIASPYVRPPDEPFM